MSALLPTNNTSIIIDEFIAYATAHLQTVSGVINTVSLYPPLGTPGPGIVLWSGYTVAPAQQQPSTAQQQQESNNPSNTVDGQTVDDNYEKPPSSKPLNVYDSQTGNSDSDLPPGTFGTFENNTGTGNYNPPKGTYGYNSNSVGYGGFSGGNVSTSDTLRLVYIPVLNKVHADKSIGIRTLMAAQTQLEGFYKGTASFRTNNPGNVYPKGNKSGFATLEEGTLAQWRYVLGPIFGGTSQYYKPSFSLFKYLSIYAPVGDGGNNPTAYTNFIISYFKKQGFSITADTTLDEIKNITK
jgi:hypothetical protein